MNIKPVLNKRESSLLACLVAVVTLGAGQALSQKVGANDVPKVAQVQTMNVAYQPWEKTNFDLATHADSLGFVGVAKVYLKEQQATLYFDVTEHQGTVGLGEATVYKDGAKLNVGTIEPQLMTEIVDAIELEREQSFLDGYGGAV